VQNAMRCGGYSAVVHSTSGNPSVSYIVPLLAPCTAVRNAGAAWRHCCHSQNAS